jgi:anaerobic selenocysteine-containing dehydrogenase
MNAGTDAPSILDPAAEVGDASDTPAVWKQSACILCESNCGIEIRLGADGKQFERIRGDKAHPGSQGYTCEKALRLNHYQNGTQRLTSPLRRTVAGTYEEIDWETAIREVAAGFAKVRDTHGGHTIFSYGGGGQGNHLGGGYSGATLRSMGSKFRSNALAQEKTGEFWVNAKMLGGVTRPDFEHTEVAVFVGKNPWHSHGFPHARTVLKEISKDPTRSLIVIDPKLSETAELADIHLRIKPGTDAWVLAAMVGVIVQEGLAATSWLAEHADGADVVHAAFGSIDVARYSAIADVDEQLVREAARRIARATSAAVFEDLGLQMGRHSTLGSYLEKLVWMLSGHFGRRGTGYIPTSMVSLARSDKAKPGSRGSVSPVVGARIISGLVPCNVITEEILTDHPDRYRAMFVESGNPAHSLADSRLMREALLSLEHLVVVDVAMTETARLAHYVLPAQSQFEKWEATFFNFEFPSNVFHLRRPVVEPLANTLPEPEIHARLVEAMGALSDADYAPLRAAAEISREAYATAFFAATTANPKLGELAPVVLYRTLGPTLDAQYGAGASSAALLWGACHRCALGFPDAVRRAGFDGEGLEPGEKLFDAVMTSASGVVFTVDEFEDSWGRVKTENGKLNLVIPELLAMLPELETGPVADPDYPLVLSAGERRAFTANTIIRDNTWRKKDAAGSLRMSPQDADALGLIHGAKARITSSRGSVIAPVEVTHMMRPGHVSLPNGMGVGSSDDAGAGTAGVAPNELTDRSHRDPIAGTPFHKQVPVRVEAVEILEPANVSA